MKRKPLIRRKARRNDMFLQRIESALVPKPLVYTSTGPWDFLGRSFFQPPSGIMPNKLYTELVEYFHVTKPTTFFLESKNGEAHGIAATRQEGPGMGQAPSLQEGVSHALSLVRNTLGEVVGVSAVEEYARKDSEATRAYFHETHTLR